MEVKCIGNTQIKHMEETGISANNWAQDMSLLRKSFGVLITGHIANQDVLLLATLRY